MRRWFFIAKTAVAGAGSTGLGPVFTIDVFLGDRYGLQSLLLDQAAANNADTIGSTVDALDSFIELFDVIAGALRVEECFFALDGVGSLLGSVKGVRLIIGLELAGGIEDVLAENFKFFPCFLHLLNDELAKHFQIFTTVAFGCGSEDFGVIGKQAHFGGVSRRRLNDASAGRYFLFNRFGGIRHY